MNPPPSHREPVFNIPGATLLLVLALLAAHALRGFLAEADDDRLIVDWAFMPIRLLWLFDATAAVDALDRLIAAGRAAGADQQAEIAGALAGFVARSGESRPATLVTYAFLHGDWAHVGVNSVWLLAFGSAVNRRFGSIRFLLLFFAGVVAGAVTHAVFDWTSVAPLIGASAGVSACCGAAARFAFAPGGPLAHPRHEGDQAFRVPAVALARVFADRRTAIFVGTWFIINFVVGYLAEPFGLSASPVAWLAHAGGFLVGLVGFALFDPARP